MELNKIYCENCLDTMLRMPDSFIDLTVTSPPYDSLRDYKGYSFDFESIAKELFRVTKKGGVVVWVVGDATIDGSETGTSFRQALYFKEIGFNLHDTMIWEKDSPSYPSNKNSTRYSSVFEFMFILSKGAPGTVNLIFDKLGKYFTGRTESKTDRKADGKLINTTTTLNQICARFNIWKYGTGDNKTTKDRSAYEHPAMFPEKLAQDHIKSWSNENDIVYDPFSGSGTTAKMAHLLKRNWIGSEISQEYVDLANKRLWQYLNQKTIFDK